MADYIYADRIIRFFQQDFPFFIEVEFINRLKIAFCINKGAIVCIPLYGPSTYRSLIILKV